MRRLILIAAALAAMTVAVPVSARTLTPAESSRCRAIGDALESTIAEYLRAPPADDSSPETLATIREAQELVRTTFIPLFVNAPEPDAATKAEMARASLADLFDMGSGCYDMVNAAE